MSKLTTGLVSLNTELTTGLNTELVKFSTSILVNYVYSFRNLCMSPKLSNQCCSPWHHNESDTWATEKQHKPVKPSWSTGYCFYSFFLFVRLSYELLNKVCWRFSLRECICSLSLFILFISPLIFEALLWSTEKLKIVNSFLLNWSFYNYEVS